MDKVNGHAHLLYALKTAVRTAPDGKIKSLKYAVAIENALRKKGLCCNGLVCGNTFGEVRVPHKGDVTEHVIEGVYEILGLFDKVTDSRNDMKSIMLNNAEQHTYAAAALDYKYDNEHQPISASQVLNPRRWEDKKSDLWTTYQRVQENIIKGGISGKTAHGKRSKTRAVNGITGDIKLNNSLETGRRNEKNQSVITDWWC